MAAAILTRYGYPKVPGDQPESITDVSGPVSYVPLTPGTPGPPITLPSGGQTVTAADFGLQSLDYVTAMASQDGLYTVVCVPLLVEPYPNPPLPTQLPDGTFSSVLLKWVTATGAEASGDLSQSAVRLFARGR